MAAAYPPHRIAALAADVAHFITGSYLMNIYAVFNVQVPELSPVQEYYKTKKSKAKGRVTSGS